MKKLISILFLISPCLLSAADERPQTPFEATIYAKDFSPLVYVKQEKDHLFVKYTPRHRFNTNNTFQSSDKNSLHLIPDDICAVEIKQLENSQISIRAFIIDKDICRFLPHALDFERSNTQHIIMGQPNTIQVKIPFK